MADARIQWQPVDSLTARAIYTYQDVSISAMLHFNTQGKLINFVSDDRYRIINDKDRKQVQFSTPITAFRDFNGFTVPERATAVWKLPEGLLTYGEFMCTSVEYNHSK